MRPTRRRRRGRRVGGAGVKVNGSGSRRRVELRAIVVWPRPGRSAGPAARAQASLPPRRRWYPRRPVDPALRALVRNTVDVLPHGELERRLSRARETGRPLRVKLGLDPTAPAVTLGWAVQLDKLRAFQDAGHTAVLIVGD